MTNDSKPNGADEASKPDTAPDGAGATIERLAQALESEALTPAMLREGLGELLAAIEEARSRTERAEAKLTEQSSRLNALGSGREETMRALAETRTELARIAAERDQLRKQLTVIDGMQTDTVALTEDYSESEQIHHKLPTIEELMANLSNLEEESAAEDQEAPPQDGHERPWEEMIAPELIFSEGEDKGEAEGKAAAASGPASRALVSLDTEQPIKYPLYQQVLTIGRSEAADIRVQGEFISRIHARIICNDAGAVIEDIDSKNGIRVNSKLVTRQALVHGDVIWLGKLRFMLLETG